MSRINCKKLISILSIILIIISLFLPYMNDNTVIAATVNNTTESTKRKTIGAKIEGAEYYDELWEKYRVIAVDNGGGSGGGGGAGDSNQSHAGNSGTSNEAGGVFGEAAGQGLGSGNTQNVAGNSAGTTGSKTADALRAQKQAIEESRAESIAKVLESAANESIAREYIERQESIIESYYKKQRQESIKQSLAAKETYVYETPAIETIETREKSTHDLEIKDDTKTPTKSPYETTAEIAPLEYTISSIEPGDLVEETEPKNQITPKALIKSIDSPTAEYKYKETETITSTVEETLEVYESPNIESIESAPLRDAEADNIETYEGMGSKGGKDAEADEDMSEEAGKEESAGNAKERGKSQAENYGKNGGKKIFELDRTGNLGINPDRTPVTDGKVATIFAGSLIFILGVASYLLSMRDKKDKRNYF